MSDQLGFDIDVPELAMKWTAVLNGRPVRVTIYREPRGVPFSWQILGPGGNSTSGAARTLADARSQVAGYLTHQTLPSELWDVTEGAEA